MSVNIGVVATKDNGLREIMLTPYLESLQRAGARTTLIEWNVTDEEIEGLCRDCGGLLFTGGSDLQPSLYGEETLPECGETDPDRDDLEMRLLKAWLPTRKPVFAICRGLQSLNVGLGGSLYQDLPTQRPSAVVHRPSDLMKIKETVHAVRIAPDGILRGILGRDEMEVNSMHHQAVKVLAGGLTSEAEAPDGVVEAYRLEGYPWLLAVQWHPEHLSDRRKEHQALFDAFVKAVERNEKADFT
jgi:putative glutamine amidotransferase